MTTDLSDTPFQASFTLNSTPPSGMLSCGSGSSSPRPITSPANTASEVRNPSVGVAIPAHVQACAGPAPKLPASTRLLTRATMRRPDLALTKNMTPILLNSAHQLAAVDLDDLTNEVVRGGRRQENHHPGYLLRSALAPYRDSPHQRFADVGGREAVVEWGGDDAGRYGVDQDVLGDELLGHRPGEGADASLGGRVRCGARSAPVAGGDRGHVDDPALALALHQRQDGPGTEEDALQVDVHHAVPEVFGHLREVAAFDQGPCVVDQDVYPAITLLDLPHHPLYLPGVRHVAPNERRLAARRGDPLDHLLRLVLAAIVVDHHPAALLRQSFRCGASNPRAAPRDPRHLFIENHVTVTSL